MFPMAILNPRPNVKAEDGMEIRKQERLGKIDIE
jgi:hypothetical protein